MVGYYLIGYFRYNNCLSLVYIFNPVSAYATHVKKGFSVV